MDAMRQNKIYQSIVAKGINPDQIQPSFLRLEQLADPAKSSYGFEWRKNVGVSRPTERRLDQNDSFVAAYFGLQLLLEDTTKPGTGILQSYPNSVHFPSVAGEVATGHLSTFYNGSFHVSVDNKTVIESLPTFNNLLVPMTQESANNVYSEHKNLDGLVALEPVLILNGSKNNTVTLNVPTFGGLQNQYVAGTSRIFLVAYAVGFLVNGASNLGALSERAHVAKH